MPFNPKSLENLKPYPPGVSGNPGGMPKGASVLGPMLRKLAAEPNEHGEGKRAVEMAERLLSGAEFLAKGIDKETKVDVGPILRIMERTDPEIKQSHVVISGDGSVPL